MKGYAHQSTQSTVTPTPLEQLQGYNKSVDRNSVSVEMSECSSLEEFEEELGGEEGGESTKGEVFSGRYQDLHDEKRRLEK